MVVIESLHRVETDDCLMQIQEFVAVDLPKCGMSNY